MTVSVDPYANLGAAAAAYPMVAQESKAAPGFEPASSALGREAFAGTSQAGAEMYFDLGARDGRPIMSATPAGDIDPTPDNSNRPIGVGQRGRARTH